MAGGFHVSMMDEKNPRMRMETEKADRRERYMQKTRAEASYLFKYLIITQMVVYLEAGAIPCLLDQLSLDLHMNASQQGALGGVVYLSLSAASPLCAYFLHRFNPRHILGLSLICNNCGTLFLALIPTDSPYSANLMILARAWIGFTQAFPCIYTPLWVDEYAPREKVAGWMSYLQGSVPMGVMMGYLMGTISNWILPERYNWFATWRWPFLLQFFMMVPIMIAIFFVPDRHLIIRNEGEKPKRLSHEEGEKKEEGGGEQVVVGARVNRSRAKSEEGLLLGEEKSGNGTRARRKSRSATSDLIDYIEEALRFKNHPPLSWSGPHHEGEDALLASASMFGGTHQRGLRQLHHNQQHQQLENDSFLRRSMISELSPELVSSSPEQAPNGYGTIIDSSSSCSSTRSLLEVSILEEEFIEVYEQGSFLQGLKELMHIPIFLLIVFGLTAVYFVVTGVQYWSTIFMIKSLKASKYVVNGLFVLVAGTGPIMGVFYGGWLIDYYGGYIGIQQRSKSLGLCMILGLIAFAIAAATTFFNDIFITAGCLWLLLFFGGSILPACTGIFISVVPPKHRAVASSFSVMIFNLIGYSLSPYLTGIVMEWVLTHHGQKGSYFETCDEACAYRIGFRFCLFGSLWSVVCIASAWIIARKQAAIESTRQVYNSPVV